MIAVAEARKRQLRRGAWAAAGLLLFAGCEDSRGRAPLPPTAPSAVTACLTAAGELTADVNNDGYRDRVVDPSRVGARLTITFGVGSARETRAGVRALADRAGEHQQFVRAAVADFDGDGWTDLVVVAGGGQRGDDPIDPKISELRLGPFSDTGRGQRTVHLDMGAVKDIAVADNNQDRYPDLLAYTYSGDGVYETRARLGDRTAGLTNDPHEYTDTADGTGYDPPDDFLHAGPESFYPRCAAGDVTAVPDTA
uniref:FG-GAP repeat domain-containing protein n=1 Tax=Streptomyces asoensis TaxID=249586 RepID=UPI00209BC6D5|nr:VCBS repeat-containing protein [Streptomyces asoensis]